MLGKDFSYKLKISSATTTQRTISISIYIFSYFSWGLVNEIRFARQIRHMCCMTLFSKGKKSDFYDVLPIHTILLDIFLPSSTTCRTRPTVANKFTSITRDVIQNGAYLVRHLGFYLIFRCKQKNNSNMNTIKIR